MISAAWTRHFFVSSWENGSLRRRQLIDPVTVKSLHEFSDNLKNYLFGKINLTIHRQIVASTSEK